MTLKQKTVNGLIWSFIDNSVNLGIGFIIGIILARLLSPHEFGLVGMISIFIAISQSFIDSGFSQALIRKRECTQTDYSTVFIFNLAVGVFFYLALFFFAGSISIFFNEPQLKLLIQVLGISLIINALTIVQITQLSKRLDFKLQTRISIITSTVSGIVAVFMAFRGYGVWSLVAKTILQYTLNSILLWYWNKWRPFLIFDKKSFKEMFSFGYKLLLSGLIDTLYNNVYYLIIGKFFSAVQLGLYSRADQFQRLPSQNITRIIQRVSYPVLVTIHNDIPKLKFAYQKLIRSTMLITFVLMLGMAAVAKPMILTLIGDKWLPSVEYLQLLCFVGVFFPLHAINLNMLQVQGRSDLFLKLEIIKKIMAIPIIFLGIFFGIKIMIIGMFFNSLVAYYLNSYWSGKFLNYSIMEQIKDILPALLLAIMVNGVVYLAGILIKSEPVVVLSLQISIGAILIILIGELLKLQDYIYIKEIIVEKFIKRK